MLETKDNKRFMLWEELNVICNRERNYAELRKAMKSAEMPIIPYLGMFAFDFGPPLPHSWNRYLTDITFIEEGNKDEINGLINFAKRRLIAEALKDIKTYQIEDYNFVEIPSMQAKLKGETILSEDELYTLSEYLEPRPGKERGPRPALLDQQRAAHLPACHFDSLCNRATCLELL